MNNKFKNKILLIDSHAHLEMNDFKNDRDQVLQRAQSLGIQKIITVGTNIFDCKKVIKIAKKYQFVYASIGIHPNEIKDIKNNTTLDFLKKLANTKKVVAYGEIGLDFNEKKSITQSNINQQINIFVQQLELAKELNLPVIIHSRNANLKLLEILKIYFIGRIGIIHCFNDSYEIAKSYLDLGFYISISGIITFLNAENLRNVVKKIPLNRIIVETDSPFLTPVPFRGKRNEPSFIIKTVNMITKIKNITLEEISINLQKNNSKIFCFR